MKKLFTVLLAIALAAVAPVSAAAANSATAAAGDSSIDVNGLVNSNSIGPTPATKISVDVAWESMDFTFREGNKGVWNPKTHVYDNTTEGVWSTNKPKITLTNHSNTAIEASFQFLPGTGVTSTGTFYKQGQSSSDLTALKAAEQTVALASAVGTAKTAPPTGNIYFGIGGDAVEASCNLGTITVSIVKSDKIYDVNSLYQALSASAGKSGTIKLGCDIDMTQSIYEGFLFMADVGDSGTEKPLVLDLNGYTLKGIIYANVSYIVIQNGTVSFSEEDVQNITDPDIRMQAYYSGVITVDVAPCRVELKNVTVNADGMMALCNFGILTASNSTIKGGLMNSGQMVSVLNQGGMSFTDNGTVEHWICLFGTSAVAFGAGKYSMNGTTVQFTAQETVYYRGDNNLPDWISSGGY